MLRDSPASRVEVLIGRWMAVCAHPYAAWLFAPRPFRALLVGGYFVMGFVAVLTALVLFA